MHHRAVGVLGLQGGDRDKLSLREFEHVVAAIDDLDVVVGQLGDDVAGHVKTVRVEDAGSHLGAFVVPEEHAVGLQQQLTARVRLVGGEVAQFGHVNQLVVNDRRALHDAVAEHHAGLGGAVAIGQIQLKAGFDELTQLLGQRSRTDHDRRYAATEEVVTDIGLDLGRNGLGTGGVAARQTPVHLGLESLEHHVAHAWNQGQGRRADQLHVLEER
ncbi:Uncharacterised protein [Mycobacteroides abscessus subsp. bolletii]|nr:Uncharacterised protein [Mycobacteroides abscessus subsp. bolletii]SKG67473.1 Uncharacterised protein [Mycobacteroides abscessus subsp. bolletii]SKH66121.1 Uncharacterised protein [Mycobacteroides abscessus subsp. bolletii]SKK12986.1 Uncharacterised protein [Mycobacteroides abscessus subsp. bolletii]SKM30518.1 Uncharacterised protein [Mycobacteroides abscessus subsp. bolletii]